jgi:hypothetical protein
MALYNANTVNTASVFAKEALKSLRNQHALAGSVHRAWKSEWSGKLYNGYKPGATVSVEKPPKFIANSGATITAFQATNPSSVDIVVDDQYNVPLSFTGKEKTMLVTDLRKYVDEAIIPLNEKVNVNIAALHKDLHHMVGSPSANFDTFAKMRSIRTRFEKIAAPVAGRVCVYDPETAARLADNLKTVFQPTMVADWMKHYALGRIADVEQLESVNIKVHTGGDWLGAPAIDGASQTGASLVIKSFTGSATIKAGDIFTIADVYDVNPRTYESNGYLKQFVCTADQAATGGGAIAAMTISPGIVTSGARQNVSTGPADGALLTVVSGTGANAHKANMAFTKQTFAYVCVPMEVPEGAVWSVRETAEDGLSVRITKFYDGVYDQDGCRLDILTGVKTTYPETGIKVVEQVT